MIKISDAEYEVMKVIWKKRKATSQEIIRELKNFEWNDNTVRTLIRRLIDKKAIGIFEKNGKTYTYMSLISERCYKSQRSKNFIKQFFDNSINDMILSFVENDELSQEELQELINKIDEIKNKTLFP